ncbi:MULTISPECIES: DUF3617 domain-containing protein [Sphingomonas]|jgi:type IV secretory pathway protease TraF|uniref:DUF3617 domain-containing protein n=1 Tax=Sphingomonas TaxID=13687 RepID=UPI002413A245|nr:hypothetical protein [Sphingomonas echinoides]
MIANKRTWVRAGLAGIGLLMGSGLVAAVSAPSLTALARVERGEWQLKQVGTNPDTRTLCIRDPRVLIHYAHEVEQCHHTVVANDINTTAMHFTCRGSHGQTIVKVATPRSFNLDTQGVINGAPFEDSFDARYLGPCSDKAK